MLKSQDTDIIMEDMDIAIVMHPSFCKSQNMIGGIPPTPTLPPLKFVSLSSRLVHSRKIISQSMDGSILVLGRSQGLDRMAGVMWFT